MNTIYAINGPVIKVKDTRDFSMREMVYVGEKKLIGEVIGVSAEFTIIQVYENTDGLKVGEQVYTTGSPMSATLGPGIISNIYDGIERPLGDMKKLSGAFVSEGSDISALDLERKYDVTLTVKAGDKVTAGQVYATCPETPLITHKCMIPPSIKEAVVSFNAENGQYTVNDTVLKLKIEGEEQELPLTLCQKWAIR